MESKKIINYSDAFILVTGDIEVVNGNDNILVAFKNCHPFIRALVHLNVDVGKVENLDLIMKLYNLIEYSIQPNRVQ